MATPGTAVRDKFNINQMDQSDFSLSTNLAEDTLECRFNLKKSLAKLPAPKNDYEIVLPEAAGEKVGSGREDEEMHDEPSSGPNDLVDQADLDQFRLDQIQIKNETEFKLKSRAVQRQLPRPKQAINTNIIRPVDAQAELNEWQSAEELIKKEMLYMLHMDAINEPPVKLSAQAMAQIGDKCSAYLRENYAGSRPREHKFTLEELREASAMLESEIPLIKKAMGHGELTGEVFAQVWEECYNQVLFVPGSNRFTRASVTSRKDKIESFEKKWQVNREIMSKEARSASKLEQKLKIIMGGYQVRI